MTTGTIIIIDRRRSRVGMLSQRRSAIQALGLFLPPALAVGGCDRKLPFSPAVFEKAKAQCGAKDAYIMPDHPKAIAFHGSSDDHGAQAQCLKDKLQDTDMEQIVLIGSQIYVTS